MHDLNFSSRLQVERGAVAVEFAIIATLLLMLVFGIIEFGLTFSRYEVYLNAAREGARHGAVRAERSDILDAVEDAASGYPIDRDQIAISPAGDPPCTDITAGEELRVSWDQVFSIQIPFLPDLSPTVTIQGVFMCE